MNKKIISYIASLNSHQKNVFLAITKISIKILLIFCFGDGDDVKGRWRVVSNGLRNPL